MAQYIAYLLKLYKLFYLVMLPGRINLKICGGGPDPCCSVTNIGDFNGDGFNEGEIDNYSGNELEGCFNYALSTSDGPSDLSLTVYHEGSDGGQLDWVEIHTDSHSVRCPLGKLLFITLWKEFSRFGKVSYGGKEGLFAP